MERKLVTLLASLSVVLATLALPARPALAQLGPCSANPSTYVSKACLKAGMGSGPWGGMYSQWNSTSLNISRALAEANPPRDFVEQGIWYYNNFGPSTTWLEVGDTAGIAYGQPRVGHWERWWLWVDGTRGIDFYTEHRVAQSPSDGGIHSYEIQWNGSGPTQGWGVYIDGGLVGGYGAPPGPDNNNNLLLSWDNPNNFFNFRVLAGLEITSAAFALNPDGTSNSNTRDINNVTQTFDFNPLQVRDIICCAWSNWPNGTSQVDGPQPCDSASPPYACMNGVAPTVSEWLENKPR
jgi:hypothetical protein